MTEEKIKPLVDGKQLIWNRVQLLVIFVVFVAPIVGAFVYKPSAFNNYGDIYSPVRVVPNLVVQGKQGALEFDSFRRQWVFLITANGVCSDMCENNLLKIRQLRFMQNNNMSRIRAVFLHSQLDDDRADDLAAKYSPVEAYNVHPDDYESWIEVLKLQNVPVEAQQERFYIIDPAGNLMMSYPATADPNLIKKDIKRLLKASQIG